MHIVLISLIFWGHRGLDLIDVYLICLMLNIKLTKNIGVFFSGAPAAPRAAERSTTSIQESKGNLGIDFLTVIMAIFGEVA